ncbi:MAG: hypothetical protein V1933_00025 [Candidatus Omnitrophota bacterium]
MDSEKCKLKDCQDIAIDYKVSSKFFGTGGAFSTPDFNEKIREFSIGQDNITIKGERETLCFIKASSEVIKKIEIEIHNCIGKPMKSIEEIDLHINPQGH